MLAHRLRRWSNIKAALVQCLVFAGMIPSKRGSFNHVLGVMFGQRHSGDPPLNVGTTLVNALPS